MTGPFFDSHKPASINSDAEDDTHERTSDSVAPQPKIITEPLNHRYKV